MGAQGRRRIVPLLGAASDALKLHEDEGAHISPPRALDGVPGTQCPRIIRTVGRVSDPPRCSLERRCERASDDGIYLEINLGR